MRGSSSVTFDAQQSGAAPGVALADPASGIDGYAETVKCPRHIPMMRACRWDRDKPCSCRLAVAESPPIRSATTI